MFLDIEIIDGKYPCGRTVLIQLRRGGKYFKFQGVDARLISSMPSRNDMSPTGVTFPFIDFCRISVCRIIERIVDIGLEDVNAVLKSRMRIEFAFLNVSAALPKWDCPAVIRELADRQ